MGCGCFPRSARSRMPHRKRRNGKGRNTNQTHYTNPPESLSPSHIYRMARFLPDIIAVLSFHPFKREVLEARIRILLEVFDRHEEDSPEMNRRESTQLA